MNRRAVAVVLAAIVFGLLTMGAKSCDTGSSDSGSTDQASPSQSSAPQKHKKKKVHAETQYYEGTGDKNLGTIVVPVDSTLEWSQPTKTNFAITNDYSDDNTIDVNSIGTHDTSQVAAGTYHKVDVIGTDWKMKIVPNK